jgi:apolipoprotein N-acyltransferase
VSRPLLDHLAARRGWRAFATALGLGALAAAALPPVHAVPVLWLSIAGLLAMLDAAPGWRRAAWIGFAWGWGHHVAGLYWITHALLTDPERWWWLVPIAVPALALPLGAFLAIPAAAAVALARPGWPRLLVFAGAWTLTELLRGWAFTGFPWNLAGSVWAFHALPVQLAAWVGVHGLGLLTVLLAGLPVVLGWRRGIAAGLAAVALGAGFGVARLWPEEPEPQPWTLVLVQANLAQEAKWREETRVPNLLRHLELTRQGVAAAAARTAPGGRIAVIWPETATAFLLGQDPEVRAAIAGVLPPGGLLLAGSVRAEFVSDGRLARVFNSLVAVDAEGAALAAYDKAHLVPFGEYMPMGGWLPIRMAASALDFTPGPGPRAIAPAGLPPAGVLICYEVIFPAAVTPDPRPDWLVNVTNDAWFGISAGPWQHLATARLRAVEEGLPLARGAQTGVSAVFDARGRDVAMSGLGVPALVVAPLPAPRAPTVFARAGLWLPALLAGAVLAVGWWRGRRRAGGGELATPG